MNRIEQSWYGWGPLTLLLLPLSGLYCLLVIVRRRLYRWGWLKSRRLPVPVLVVGNITVGGTGKTPLVIWLANWLKERELRPGIVTRGYGGRSTSWPRRVEATTDASEVGDEAVLLSRRAACPVYAGPDRYETGRILLAEQDCDILISDDGLQHYALQRDLELALIDGERRFGNGLCLPAGPLRETTKRLHEVDLILTNGHALQDEYPLRVLGRRALPLRQQGESRSLNFFADRAVAAVAGIGNPERFFGMLESLGVKITRHAFPDHHPFQAEDLAPFKEQTVLMTEKDAVKCEAFAGDNCWFIPVEASCNKPFTDRLEQLVNRLLHGQKFT